VKIRTKEHLLDVMSAEIVWRRKELTDLCYLVQQTLGQRTRQEVVTRAAVALLYAHWEGFVKAAAEDYLEFVGMQRCKNSELAASMVAIMVRGKLRAAQASKRIASHLEVVDFFRTHMQERGSLPCKNAIRTDANLSSAVLIDILHTLVLLCYKVNTSF
jgi:MAE_28990/MAE_18760-like HEPN